MNGPSHCLSGVLVGVAAARVADADAPTAITWVAVSAGAALWPDIDHHGATATRAAGWLSRLVHEAVDVLGSHRGPTHSLLGAAAMTALAQLATQHPAGLGVLLFALLVPALKIADRIVPGSHELAVAVTAALALGVAAGGTAAVDALGIDTTPLPALVGSGVLAHVLGDQLTDSGVRWLWPVGPVTRLPVTITTGGWVERIVVRGALASGIAWLALSPLTA